MFIGQSKKRQRDCREGETERGLGLLITKLRKESEVVYNLIIFTFVFVLQIDELHAHLQALREMAAKQVNINGYTL